MAKRAVVVGINDYAPIGGGGPDLRGCVNDARDMANTLVICGFPVPNIRIHQAAHVVSVGVPRGLFRKNFAKTANHGGTNGGQECQVDHSGFGGFTSSQPL